MHDMAKRERFEQLRDAAERGTLSAAEHAEWTALEQQCCRNEESAVLKATRHTEEANAALGAQLHEVQAQNSDLEALLREQETYLQEVQRLIGQLEAHRQDWRDRYEKLTGRSLSEATTTPRGD